MLPEGMNAPGILMPILCDLLTDNQGQFMWVYIDDILIYSDREQEHLEYITMVCDKLKQAQFYASRRKS